MSMNRYKRKKRMMKKKTLSTNKKTLKSYCSAEREAMQARVAEVKEANILTHIIQAKRALVWK